MQTAALYIRVSTEDQLEYSPDAQKRLLTEYAQKNNMLVSSEYIFIDEGISGRKAKKRPAFQQMIGLAKSKDRPFDAILVWKFSRFARNQEESIVYKSLLKKNSVDVISISEPLIDGPFGSLIERIIEWMDEYYSIRLSGEVTKGMTEKALKGGYQCSPPYGYEIKRSGDVPTVIQPEAEIVKMIFDKYVNGRMSFFTIARYLNDLGIRTNKGSLWQRRRIEYTIMNPMYKGWLRWNHVEHATKRIKDESDWIITRGQHEAIVSEELWDAAQEKYKSTYTPRNSRPPEQYRHWLSSIIKCAYCSSSLVPSKVSRSKYLHFTCSGYKKGKCKVCNNASENLIVPGVLESMGKAISEGDFTFTIMESDTKESDLILLKKQLSRIEEKEKRIKFSYAEGVDTFEEYKQNKIVLNKERKEIEENIKSLTKSKVKNHKKEMQSRIKEVYEIVTSPDYDNAAKNNAMKSIVEKIVLDRPNGLLDICYYYR